MRERLSPWMLLLCAFLLFFIIYLAGAVWPVFIASRGLREGALGLIIGFYGLALLVARVPLGFLCDLLEGNRRTVISAGFLCIALGLLLPGVFASAWPLFVSRILLGVGAGSFVAIADLYTLYSSSRSAGFGMAVVASFFGWGQIPANPLGGWLADRFGLLMPFWVSAVVAVLAAVLALAIVEPRPHGVPAQRVLLPKSANLYIGAIMMAVVFFGVYATVYNVTQLYAAAQLGINKATQGLLLAAFISLFVGVVLTSPLLAKTFGVTGVVTTGMAFLGTGALLTPVANLPVLFLCEVLLGVGLGLTFGLLMALSVEGVPTGQRFYAMGIFQSIYAAGMLLGPVTAGYVTQAFGYSAAFWSVGSIVLLAGTWFLLVRVGVFAATVRLIRD
jgi:MFS family permease